MLIEQFTSFRIVMYFLYECSFFYLSSDLLLELANYVTNFEIPILPLL